MANTAARVVAGVAILTAGVASRIDAAQGAEMAVVLHVTDDAQIPPGILAEAKRQAGSVYFAAGVRTVWTGGAARTAQPDGAFHADVVVVSKDMKAGRANPKESPNRPSAEPRGRLGEPTSSTIAFSITRCGPAPTSPFYSAR